MQLGMVGLGRMGGSMVRRLMRGGHACVVFDARLRGGPPLAKDGATGARRFEAFVQKLTPPRAIWIMVPAGDRRRADRRRLRAAAAAGRHRDRRRQLPLQGRHPPRDGIAGRRRLHYVDVGTSGGVWGLERGYCLMIGGAKDASSRTSIRSSRRSRPAADGVPDAGPREAAAPPSTATCTAARAAPATS